MSLYSMRTQDSALSITKFDSDLNPIDTYTVSDEFCTCPAGHRDTCRHRQMLPVFLACDAIDQPMFWDYDSKEWLTPIADDEALCAAPVHDEASLFRQGMSQQSITTINYMADGSVETTTGINPSPAPSLRRGF